MGLYEGGHQKYLQTDNNLRMPQSITGTVE